MIYHTKAVQKGVKRAMIVVDMPFMSYQTNIDEAFRNAGRIMKETEAGAVKIEGGELFAKTVAKLTANGIPVMGHIGLTPQAIHKMGGYKVQGRDEKQAQRLKEDALILQEAGVFSLVLESIPWALAKEITASLTIPTIGIGAGKYCDGQVLVVNDMLGWYGDFTPKFVKKYANIAEMMKKAFGDFKKEVEKGIFPDEEHSYK
jgi:3-methyl-2-oxobutanoate hydroxymethyltransferase